MIREKTMKKSDDSLKRIADITDEVFHIVFKHLDVDAGQPDWDGVIRIETEERNMDIALNALGNVIAGLMCAMPNPADKMEWFCMNLVRSCREVLTKRDGAEAKITLQ